MGAKAIIITTTVMATLLYNLNLYGQGWRALASWGGLANESLEALLHLPDGRTLAGGTFSGEVPIGGELLRSVGAEDMFIAEFSPGGQPRLHLHLGSPGQDLLVGMGVSTSGGLYCGGTFWQQLNLPGSTALVPAKNPKAVFAVQFAPGPGNSLRWARMIEGGSIKELCAVAPAPDGGLLLAGFFSDTLFIDTFSLAASGKTDAFLVRLDALGQVVWAKRFGGRGDVRIKAMVLAPGETPVIAGVYNDQVIFGNTSLIANTRDWDIFVAALGMDGSLRWARKAGGVYDDEVHAIAADRGGNLYLTGQFLGVLDLGPGQGIQSQDGNADGFVLKYQPNGTPVWGKVFSGDKLQISRAIAVQDSMLAIAGFFQENLRADGNSLSGSEVFNGFLAFMQTDGRVRDLIGLPGELPVFPEAVVAADGQSWKVGGVYRKAGLWGPLSLPPVVGGFDIFLAHWGLLPTRTSGPHWSEALEIFPNPAPDGIWIRHPEHKNFGLVLFDLNGRLLAEVAAGDFLPTSHLAPGVYFLEIRSGNEKIFRKFVR